MNLYKWSGLACMEETARSLQGLRTSVPSNTLSPFARHSKLPTNDVNSIVLAKILCKGAQAETLLCSKTALEVESSNLKESRKGFGP